MMTTQTFKSKLSMNFFTRSTMAVCLLVLISCGTEVSEFNAISKTQLKDKIKGAWAGQTIGVSFGSPVEFKYKSTLIPDYHQLRWDAEMMKEIYEHNPGVYDDIYMDLTFVQVFDKLGLDAPVDSFAQAFARAEYPLWFANQTARRNILDGLSAPASGHWLNNPCADDIDFQIEADFAGIMAPGMIHKAVEICDKVGHIMNYGDGYYGGVFVASMYAQSFVSEDVHEVIDEAMKTIPAESQFAQVMADVIKWHEQDPEDWKGTWFKVHRKWSSEIGSAVGVFDPFNIDAKINAAWVVLGLLYGDGDFGRTLEIATRCGDDADCNPASAGGILGSIIGYDAIPEYWKQGLSEVEPIDFKFTDISLNDVYEMSYDHALAVIESDGGKIDGASVEIPIRPVETVPLEIAFPDHYPTSKPQLNIVVSDTFNYAFEGRGFVIRGKARKTGQLDYIFKVEMSIDGEVIQTVDMPTDFVDRRFYLFWGYDLGDSDHTVGMKVLNPTDEAEIYLQEILIYGAEPLVAATIK